MTNKVLAFRIYPYWFYCKEKKINVKMVRKQKDSVKNHMKKQSMKDVDSM
jgi:hypothetical protein